MLAIRRSRIVSFIPCATEGLGQLSSHQLISTENYFGHKNLNGYNGVAVSDKKDDPINAIICSTVEAGSGNDKL